MIASNACTRPRLLLALLLAALVGGAVPVRMAAARWDKPSGAASWRAASIRPAPLGPDVDARGAPPVPAATPEPLVPRIVRAEARRPGRSMPPAPPLARSPAARAPPG